MLAVYRYVACGLAVTGVTAYFVMYSGFHAAMMELTPPFLLPFAWIFLLAPLALAMLFWLCIDEMSLLAAEATCWTCAALTGFVFECISQVYIGASLAPAFLTAAGTFATMSICSYMTGADPTTPRYFVGVALIGVVLAGGVNFLLGSTAVELALSATAILALVGLAAWDTPRLKAMYLDSDDGRTINRKALVGAFALYLDANPIVLLLRLESLYGSKPGE
jgi:FtsH-binding integral membrane protein